MTAPNATDPILSPEDLRRVCDFLYRRTGIVLGENKRYFIERRVFDRMASVGAVACAPYFAVLRADAAEAEQLINSITVNETYFWREMHQFECLTRALLPEITLGKLAGDKIRIWSNPCSTGEEAYSIAIWLLERWPLVDAYHVEISGSDLDSRALAAAVLGHYGERSLSRLPPALVNAYFEPAGPHPHAHAQGRRIIQDLRESVIYSPVNLIDRPAMLAHGRFEVIFCRNVLIYFDDEARQAAVRNLHDCLAPGGFLCLGHAESMARISDRFIARRFEEGVVYQRPRVAA
jgi:chemotaxis protein methyltransferase CheR